MSYKVTNFSTLLFAAFLLSGSSYVLSQDGKAKINPYSPSPVRKQVAEAKDVSTPRPSVPDQVSFAFEKSGKTARTAEGLENAGPVNKGDVDISPGPAAIDNAPTPMFKIAEGPSTPTVNDAKAAESDNSADSRKKNTIFPTETYRVGVGDVLYINIENVIQSSGYFTVRPDGTIDFPIAGDFVAVAGKTTQEIEASIKPNIRIVSSPKIAVKVREFASHKVTVTGHVEQPGERSLQREAVPLFVIRAESLVDSKATRVAITSAGADKPQVFDLRNPKTNDVLIYPGSTVDFISDEEGRAITPDAFYFIAGPAPVGGQKQYTRGMTLYQAVIAAGTKGDAKKATVRRKNGNGAYVTTEFDLRSIRDGKISDPPLMAGDLIELKK
jgi:polysaccharide export outer membrane protein